MANNSKKNEKAYFGLSWIVSLILAIIPITSIVLGPIVAFQRGSTIWGIVRLVSLVAAIGLAFWIPFIGLVGLIIWVVDIISMIVNKDLKWAI